MQTINHETLKQKLDKDEDFLLLNVLSAEDFEQEHIPGSENIPYDIDNFEEEVAHKAGSTDMEIVVYCASEDCPASEKAASLLEDAGFSNVRDFDGGMQEWKDAGYASEGIEAERQAA